ncbi:hypothetical protein GT347_19595 [Xylophilus rhododendri]|uniref:Signal transduction histidine kinase internal region domain-containing protein n=1 Tax=Xylophilus rhododendri TaxID=2697032 RepID=A0A857JAC6_9BURK|nr:histidine kinase [Xylophilus rhododendri]QHI99989.1 hypothetical protein GT347_19595 [Xylophilus rhododendri]
MNTFNRMAAEPQATEELQLEQIFNLSDYLRHCLEHAVPVEVELQQEIEMLESYLRLLAAFRRCELSLPVRCLPGTRDLKLRAHSTCLIAHALLCGHPAEMAGRWTLPMRVGLTEEGDMAIDMTLRPLFHAGEPRIARVAEELQSLCDAMSSPSARWRYGILPDTGCDVAVTVRIS